jgi:hypothetical protein
MKFLLVALLSLSSLSVFAQEDFDKTKAMMSQHLDEKIADLQSAKTCVTNATGKDQLKACHEEMKAKKKAMHEKMKGMKENWKSERKAKKK